MQQDMQNNDQNNSWKSRLEDDNAFPGEEIINGHAAWDALCNRLHQPSRKKAVWYWMAAASIVAVVASVFVMQSPKLRQEPIMTKTSIKQNAAIDEIEPAQPGEIVATLPVKDITAPVATAKRHAEGKVFKYRNKALIATESNPVEEVKEEMAGAAVHTEEKDDEQLVAIQPKPMLKVVHINELGGSTQNNVNKRGADYSVLRIGTSGNTTQPAGKIGIQISTAKTSPVN